MKTQTTKNGNGIFITTTICYIALIIGLFFGFLYSSMVLKCMAIIGLLGLPCCIVVIAVIKNRNIQLEVSRLLLWIFIPLIMVTTLLAMVVVTVMICSQPITGIIFLILLITSLILMIRIIKQDNKEEKEKNRDWGILPQLFFNFKTIVHYNHFQFIYYLSKKTPTRIHMRTQYGNWYGGNRIKFYQTTSHLRFHQRSSPIRVGKIRTKKPLSIRRGISVRLPILN